MKKQALKAGMAGISAVLLLSSSAALGDEKGFAAESHQWRMKAVMTCGMLRDPKSLDPSKVLTALGEIDKEWTAISGKYLNTPPKEYASDPLWKAYFEDLADNVVVVRERVEKKQYRLAQKNCSQFCMTFSRMHQTNGMSTLTDLLFGWRMGMNGAQDMMNASNAPGAKASLDVLGKMRDGLQRQLGLPANAKLAGLVKPVMAAYDVWVAAVNAGDARKAGSAFMDFMGVFPKLFMAS
jgi:hypothetical protein